jgi:iron complex outermembrane recepter protein
MSCCSNKFQAISLAAALFNGGLAIAQTQVDEDILNAEAIVVQSSIGYRNRTEEALQTLEYGQEYFQRFEPLTAGDALKRMPSVTFLSDVIESDGARLRGLDPGYTQITINGDKVPGSNTDRSFFMDRIPAELIERVEIVRSASATRSGDAIAGTLNIVLRDAFQVDGGYIKLGGLLYDDGEVKENIGAIWGGEVAGGRLMLGANTQGRYNPKYKESLRYGDSPENDPNFATNEFDNRQDQPDTRDGTDTSFNLSYLTELSSDTSIEFSGVYVITERTETELKYEYDDPFLATGPVSFGGNLVQQGDEVTEIDQENYSTKIRLDHDWSMGETTFKLGFAKFEENVFATDHKLEFEDDIADSVYEADAVIQDVTDEEVSVEIEHEFDLSNGKDLEIGVFYQSKERSSLVAKSDKNELDPITPIPTSWDQFVDFPTDAFATAFTNFEAIDAGDSHIDETRLDFFAALQGNSDSLKWEFGLRYESTDVEISDATAVVTNVQKNDYGLFLPSAHFAYELSDTDRITGSFARTNRRPRFDYINPALLEDELGENDLQGNPGLELETAWGLDLGYERRVATSGIIGVNVFYRKVSDLIEITSTGLEGSEGPGTFILTPDNVGDGDVWGIEFDLSAPLTAFDMPNTGVFANLSLLDSSIDDFVGERKFNNQSDSVYNLGFIQDMPDAGVSFGMTYRKQSDAYERVIAEEATTSYGADLEIFIEKRFGDNLTIRAVGSNLLDASKDEVFNKFDDLDDQADRDFDEYELETEASGPVFQLVARMAI